MTKSIKFQSYQRLVELVSWTIKIMQIFYSCYKLAGKKKKFQPHISAFKAQHMELKKGKVIPFTTPLHWKSFIFFFYEIYMTLTHLIQTQSKPRWIVRQRKNKIKSNSMAIIDLQFSNFFTPLQHLFWQIIILLSPI